MGLIRLLPLRIRLPLIHGAIRAASEVRSRAWTAASIEDVIKPGPLIVSGFFNDILGIGKAGRATLRALEAAGFLPTAQDIRPLQKQFWKPGRRPVLDARPGGVWLIHANAPETLVSLINQDPDDWRGRYRIGYWAWETPQAPKMWTKVAKWLHEIWVPSAFVADAMRAAFEAIGRPEYSDKLRVMPHPIAAASATHHPASRFGLEPSVRHALVMFDGRSAFARKNPWGAIEAWIRAYPTPEPNRQLVIKALAASADKRGALHLGNLIGKRRDMRLYQEKLDDEEISDLLFHVDVLITTHRSEGFGLVPAEAMAQGTPIIATQWSAVGEYADDTTGVMLPSTLVKIKDASGTYKGAVWAEPDIGVAATALHDLLEDPERAAKMGRAAQVKIARLRDRWTRQALDQLPFSSYIETIPNRSPV